MKAAHRVGLRGRLRGSLSLTKGGSAVPCAGGHKAIKPWVALQGGAGLKGNKPGVTPVAQEGGLGLICHPLLNS